MIEPWIYNNKPVEAPTKGSIGFIYRITSKIDGRYYIGRKNLLKTSYKTTKGIKKKVMVESDWKDYFSSSPSLIEEITEGGMENYTREILLFCPTKATILLAEEYFLHVSGSMFDAKCYNQNIRATIMKKWFTKTPDFFKEMAKVVL